ncbi:Gfo/Idh/MocA family protein [Sulfobacillus harzensis]|nr:Gfo/Idh/MocA family oxidoreductase [Sulfobacillus harzensis]
MKVLMVGAGTMGRVHAQAWAEIDEGELVGVVDPDPACGASLARSASVPAFASLEEALGVMAVDVVDVCVPTYLHRATVEQALTAGCHVICEKPMALNLDEAQSMIDAATRARRQLLIAHVVRFFPQYALARQRVKNGAIGEVGTARTFRGGAYPVGWQDWYGDPNKSGTLATDLLIHDIDFLRWTFGEVQRVYAKSLNVKGDHVLVSLRFANGLIAQCEGSWAYPAGFSYAFELAGREGLIAFDSRQSRAIEVWESTAPLAPRVAIPESPLVQSPYVAELEHFLAVIRDGVEPRVTAEDAFRALELSMMVRRSWETGQPVEVE